MTQRMSSSAVEAHFHELIRADRSRVKTFLLSSENHSQNVPQPLVKRFDHLRDWKTWMKTFGIRSFGNIGSFGVLDRNVWRIVWDWKTWLWRLEPTWWVTLHWFSDKHTNCRSIHYLYPEVEVVDGLSGHGEAAIHDVGALVRDLPPQFGGGRRRSQHLPVAVAALVVAEIASLDLDYCNGRRSLFVFGAQNNFCLKAHQ